MIIMGCIHHPGFQQIAFVDTETEELQQRRLEHREEAWRSSTVSLRRSAGRVIRPSEP